MFDTNVSAMSKYCASSWWVFIQQYRESHASAAYTKLHERSPTETDRFPSTGRVDPRRVVRSRHRTGRQNCKALFRFHVRAIVKSDLAEAGLAPFIRCVAKAVEAQLPTRGVSRTEAVKDCRLGEEQAITRYLRLCAQIDSTGSDTTDDEAIFRFLVEPEQWSSR